MADTEGFKDLDDKLAYLIGISDKIEQEIAPAINNIMRDYAVQMCTNVWSAVDTGALRNSIQGATQFVMREDDVTVEMGITATSDHLKYVEFGTGIHGSAEYTSPATGETHTSEGVTFKDKAKWYQHNPDYHGDFRKNNDPNGVEEWIPRYSQHPRPIMRPALYDNVEVIKDVLQGACTEVFE